MQVDKELSGHVAGELGSGDRSAWRKAWLALQTVSELENGLYVEGWAVALDNPLVFEHAWLEFDGSLVDPTRWDRKLIYFSGLRFDKDQLLDAAARHPLLPVSWHNTDSLPGIEAYHRARKAACSLAESMLTSDQ